MTCQLTFLPVGNADSIIIQTDESTVVVDLGNLSILDEWLEVRNIHRIERLYVTHAHADHFPNLIKLVDFLSNWFDHGTIGKLHLPEKIFRIARETVLRDRSKENPKIRRLEHALTRIVGWNKSSTLKISPIVRDGEQYSENALTIQALHPSHIYLEDYLALGGGKLNEISLVLKVSYGDFSAMLLADVEGDGLTHLLQYLEANSHTVNVVKVPHHGAWPTNGDDLSQLLNLLNPELAILSVGSKNQHKHVRPELFQALIQMKQTDGLRLGSFICTEATRTCVHSTAEIASMGKQGLSRVQRCAGEITILAKTSGEWQLKTETNHEVTIGKFPYAACAGRLENTK